MRRTQVTLIHYACLAIVLACVGSSYLNLHSFTLFRAPLRCYAETAPATHARSIECPRNSKSDQERKCCDLTGVAYAYVTLTGFVPTAQDCQHRWSSLYDFTLARQNFNRGPPAGAAA